MSLPDSAPELPDERELSYARWVNDAGDKTHRLDYRLSALDIVVDLGGYEGQWTSDIYSRYRCKVHVVEPVASYAKTIAERFEKNEDVFVHQCALGAQSGSVNIALSADASSAFKTTENVELANVVLFDHWMKQLAIDEIALLKINIEGGEYDLLDYLIENGIVKKIHNIQIQFHDFVPDAASRMAVIQRQLSSSHRLTYQYLYVWENWQKIG
jgi:FkbM family methyltransferase